MDGRVALADDFELLYYGYSAGGVLGAGLVSSVVPFERGVLGAGGDPWTFLLPRSNNFRFYKMVMGASVQEGYHIRLALNLMQVFFDDITGVASYRFSEPPGVGADTDLVSGATNTASDEVLTPQLLIFAGLGDANVPRLGTETLSRGFNCSTFENTVETNPFGEDALYGLHVREMRRDFEDGDRGCMLVELLYESEFEQMPLDSSFPPESEVHFCLPEDNEVQDTVAIFLRLSLSLSLNLSLSLSLSLSLTQKERHRIGHVLAIRSRLRAEIR
mmetsp:Transcript_41789/g.130888  ORF Transcript_41789/g.130888 Transcript_41789/m.130888 type:complete len:274 (-) Transcript_41789:283-1104(-)